MSWAICWTSYCSAAICCSGLPLLYAAAPSEATCCCIICTSRTKEEPGCEKDKWNQHCARKLAFKAPPHLLSLSNTVALKKQWRSKERFLCWFDKQLSSHRWMTPQMCVSQSSKSEEESCSLLKVPLEAMWRFSNKLMGLDSSIWLLLLA